MSSHSIFPIATLRALASARIDGFLEALAREAAPVYTGKKNITLVGYRISQELQQDLAARFPLRDDHASVDVAQVRREASLDMREGGQEQPVEVKALLEKIRVEQVDTEDKIKQLLGEKPCAFEGCEERRLALEAELNGLSADCTDCEKGTIRNKHISKLKTHLKKVEAKTQDTQS